MKKLFFLISSLLILQTYAIGSGTTVTYTIDATKNAYEHNNKGVIYTEEKMYYAAIEEFKIAISLNPETQATATYYNNLGKVYLKIGYPNLALDCFNNALTQYTLNFEYYKNLVECYRQLGQIDSQLEIYKNKKGNPLDKVILGLLYEQSGNTKKAIMVFDEFTTKEPSLIITPAIKQHMKELVATIK